MNKQPIHDPNSKNSYNSIGGNIENSFNEVYSSKEPTLFSKIINNTALVFTILAGVIALLAFLGINTVDKLRNPQSNIEQTIQYQILGTWQAVEARGQVLDERERIIFRFLENGMVYILKDDGSEDDRGAYRLNGNYITLTLIVGNGAVNIKGDRMTISENQPENYGSLTLKRIDRSTVRPPEK